MRTAASGGFVVAITPTAVLSILAIVFFGLAGFGVPRAAWQWFAFACLTLAWLVRA